MEGMLCDAQRGPVLIRSSAVAGARWRPPRAIDPAAAKRAGFLARLQARSKGAFGSITAGPVRWMSAAAPGSVDDETDEPKPEPVGSITKLMGKESCVMFQVDGGSYDADGHCVCNARSFSGARWKLGAKVPSTLVPFTGGRLLTMSSGAAFAGPTFLLLVLRSKSDMSVTNDLLEKVDPARFPEAFNTRIEDAQTLFDAKAQTIDKLMKITPTGTVDPSPFIYDSTMYTMAGLMGVAAVTIKPMNPKYYEKVDVEPTPIAVDSTLRSLVAAAMGGAAFTPSMASHMVPASILQQEQ